MNKNEKIMNRIELELEHRGILCYQKSNCDNILDVEGNFKKFFNLMGKTNDEWFVVNVNHVSYFENAKYSTVDRYPEENRNEHFKIKDVQKVELWICEEFTLNLYVDVLDKKTGIYKGISILINLDAQEWTDEILSKEGK